MHSMRQHDRRQRLVNAGRGLIIAAECALVREMVDATDRQNDERFMAEALELAYRGRGNVEPNPMVGAIIVREGDVLGRGWHELFGGPHAERQAFADANQAGCDVVGATMYVTLEPCCHHGKTPPCTDAILAAKLSHVVIAMVDPDENVAGRGIEILRKAGIEVTAGVCQADATKLLSPYCKLRTTGRPWVICKWAQTADGYLALPPGDGRWISSPESRTYVHELRSRCDAILVGVDTVLADDPLLTNRSGEGKQPARVVLDSALRTPADCQLARTADASPVIIMTTEDALRERAASAKALCDAGLEIIALAGGDCGVDLPAALDEMGRRQWTHLLVEGGAKILRAFTGAGLADELLAFVSPTTVATGAQGLPRFDIAELSSSLGLTESEVTSFGEDRLLHFVVGE